MSELDAQFPIFVYRLADLPPAMSEPGTAPALEGCCFYSTMLGAEGLRRFEMAWAAAPEPPLDSAAVEVGMHIATQVHHALSETTTLAVLVATRSREALTHYKCGFHTGDAGRFRAALIEAGFTLIEADEVFGSLLRFVLSDAGVAVRSVVASLPSFVEPYELVQPVSVVPARLFAFLQSRLCVSLVGEYGGAVDIEDVPRQAERALRLDAPQRRSNTATDPFSPLWVAQRMLEGAREEELIGRWVEAVMAMDEGTRLRAAGEWVRHLCSPHVTAALGYFGNAVITALTQILGEAALQQVAREHMPMRWLQRQS